MSTAVATIEPPSVLGSMAERFGMDRRAFEATLRGTIMPANTSNEQCAAFLLVAKQHGLNPFTKEIFAFPSRGGIQPVVSVDGWMKLINSHPEFDGMEFADVLDDKGALLSVTCKIFRKDRAHPVSVTEYMSECRRPTDVWKQWPARMLRHKAAIQAARYAFGFAGIMEPDEYERMQSAHHVASVQIIDGDVDNGSGVPAAVINDDRKERCDEAAEQYAEAVAAIKLELSKAEPNMDTVKADWATIPKSAQMDLWLAPTKGGIFTTAEREAIKTGQPPKRKNTTTENAE